MRTAAIRDTRVPALRRAPGRSHGRRPSGPAIQGCCIFAALLACPHHAGFSTAQEALALPEATPAADARDTAPVRDCGITQPGKGRRRSLLRRYRGRME